MDSVILFPKIRSRYWNPFTTKNDRKAPCQSARGLFRVLRLFPGVLNLVGCVVAESAKVDGRLCTGLGFGLLRLWNRMRGVFLLFKIYHRAYVRSMVLTGPNGKATGLPVAFSSASVSSQFSLHHGFLPVVHRGVDFPVLVIADEVPQQVELFRIALIHP